MKAYLKTNDFRYIIDDYEKDMYGIDKDKIPHFTFIFYTSLVFMFLDNIDDIADYIKKRPSSKFLL